jgi:CubicO group peptidase (beta-lactamase class C family)
MSRRHSALSILCLSFLLAVLGGCTPVQHPLDHRLRSIVDDPTAPLASLGVVIVAGDAVIYESYWGWRSIDAEEPKHSQPVTPATKFRVASVSKVATAVGAMQLVEQGKLDLDADIGKYLGFALRNPYYPKRPITARMLLSHTSSLRDAGFYNLPLPFTLRDLFVPGGAYFAEAAHFSRPERGAERGPGAYFAYANLNYGVLATVMEAVSGERFDRYMVHRLFGPLTIDGGYRLGDLSDEGIRQLATIYTKQSEQGAWDVAGPWYAQMDEYHGMRPRPVPPSNGAIKLGPPMLLKPGSDKPLPAPAYVLGTNATQFGPHAGLRVSARDLAKLMLVLLGDGRYQDRRILRPGTVHRMMQEEWRYNPQTANGDTNYGRYRAWGLGLQHSTATLDELGGDRLASDGTGHFWGHRGEAYGLLGAVWLDPKRNVGFVYLIGGLGDDPHRHAGEYSSFYRWEELIQTALLGEIDRWETTH